MLREIDLPKQTPFPANESLGCRSASHWCAIDCISRNVVRGGGEVGGRRPAASVFLCLGDKLQSCVLILATLTSLTVPALKHIAGNFALTFAPLLKRVRSPSSIVLSVLLSSSFILSKSYHRTKDNRTRGLWFVESRNTSRPQNF